MLSLEYNAFKMPVECSGGDIVLGHLSRFKDDENIDLGTFKVAIALVYSGSSK